MTDKNICVLTVFQKGKIIILLAAAAFFLFSFFCTAAFAQDEYTGVESPHRYLSSINFNDMGNHWGRLPVYRSAAQGLIRGDGSGNFNPNSPFSKAEAVTAYVRMMGLNAQAEEAAFDVAANGTDWNNIDEYWENGYLQVAANMGVITGEELEEIQENRSSPVLREEAGAWAARTLGLEQSFGHNRQNLTGFRDWENINPDYVGNIASTVNEGILFGSGDNFNPKQNLTRAEMAAVIDRASRQLGEERGLTFTEGRILTRNTETESAGEQRLNRTVFLVRTNNPGDIELIAEEISGSRADAKDFPVYKNNTLGLSDRLDPGDTVNLILTEDDRVIFASVTDTSPDTFTGSYMGLSSDGDNINLTNEHGNTFSFPLDPHVSVEINGEWVDTGDLVNGQEISLTLEGGYVQSISGDTEADISGYASAEDKTINGTVEYVSGEENKITLSDSGGWTTYELEDNTEVVKDRKSVPVSRINVGDMVSAVVDSGDTVQRLDIAGEAGDIDGIIKGTVQEVSPVNREIILSDTEDYFLGSWYPGDQTRALRVESDAAVAVSGGDADLEWLKDTGKGSELYAAVVDDYRGEKAVKMLLKSGTVRDHSGTIDSIDSAAGGIDIESGSNNISFGSETITVYDGRLVNAESLSESSQAFIETNYSDGAEKAAVITSQEFYPRDYRIVRGELEEVDEYETEVDDYREFENNSWGEKDSDEVEMDVSSEVEVTDAQGTPPAKVSPDDFFYSRFTEEYDGDSIIAVERGGMVESIVLTDGFSGGDKTSIGQVASVSSSGRLTLDRVKDWSESHGRWETNAHNVYLNLDSALIYKDDELITPQAVHEGDIIYAVHDMQDVSIIFVQ